MQTEYTDKHNGESPLAIALPLVVGESLAGTCFAAARKGDLVALVTTAHQVANGTAYSVVVPGHMGDLAKPQSYPCNQLPTIPLHLSLVDYLYDIAILLMKLPATDPLPIPRIVRSPNEVRIGEDVLTIGYPYSVIGSVLETVETSQISAIGNRVAPSGSPRIELILARHSYVGSSGSPVVRKSDGTVCGVIRGCLAPPSLVAIGNIPLGSDSSVTYATSAHILPKLLQDSFENGVPYL